MINRTQRFCAYLAFVPLLTPFPGTKLHRSALTADMDSLAIEFNDGTDACCASM